jgi:hypothetical protein
MKSTVLDFVVGEINRTIKYDVKEGKNNGKNKFRLTLPLSKSLVDSESITIEEIISESTKILNSGGMYGGVVLVNNGVKDEPQGCEGYGPCYGLEVYGHITEEVKKTNTQNV